MAALCREALSLLLKTTPEYSYSPPTSDSWKQELDDFLEGSSGLSHGLSVPELLWDEPTFSEPFHPDQTPDLLFPSAHDPFSGPQAFPVKFGPDGLVLRGFHHSGIERCERPYERVTKSPQPDNFQWH